LKSRVFYLVLGVGFFALGALGILLPGLPTTPFMVLAAWAFARSSKRLHTWLTTHRVFGPPLRRWEAHRVIPRPVKIVAITAMVLSMVTAIWTEAPLALLLVMGAVMVGGTLFILRCPSRAPDSQRDANRRTAES
jgi:uncharacterized membrane protein YbaN (DUF454 family)